MRKFVQFVIAAIWILPSFVFAAEPAELNESSYKPELGVIIIQVNWGRSWKCGQFENAQLQALAFSK